MKKAVKILPVLVVFLLIVNTIAFTKETSFTQEDRDRLVRVEVKLTEMDKRLEFMQNLMIAMIGVFGGLCGVFVGLLLWDRRTFKEKAKEEAMREIEKKYKIDDWIAALKEYAKDKDDLASILKKLNLF
ncbi:MAG: hypothetical protein QXQ24_08235 [Nitrososphaeria archaeon]